MKLFESSWKQVASFLRHLLNFFSLFPLIAFWLFSYFALILSFSEKTFAFFLRLSNPHQPSKRNSAENSLGNKMHIKSLVVRWKRYNFIFMFQCTCKQMQKPKKLKWWTSIAAQIVWKISVVHISLKIKIVAAALKIVSKSISMVFLNSVLDFALSNFCNLKNTYN